MAKTLSMKLLIDTKSGRVLFAEASKDVVDFIFGLLAMPLGSIVKLLSKERMVGSMGNVYKSLENLDTTYLQPNHDKNVLLSPKIPSSSSSSLSQRSTLLLTDTGTSVKSYYTCPSYYGSCWKYYYYTDVSGTTCPACRSQMVRALKYVDPKSGKSDAIAKDDDGGCVKAVVTYTVMDDLSVMPMSSISSITLLNKFNVKDIGVLKEEIVTVGMKEGLELLKASLQSQTVLTDVFLNRKKCASAKTQRVSLSDNY